MSTRIVISGVGAAVGFAIGGPTGAMYGWSLGSIAGNIIDPQVIRGPSIGDIAQQTSQEGVPIPIVFGTSPPITGNVMATSEPRIVKSKSSGKGGPKVESESVYRTYAIGFCEGPIGGFIRVWRNNTKVYDVDDPEFTQPQPSLPQLGLIWTFPSRNEQFLEKARFFLGEYDQEPSSDLEAVFGVGTTPAHRGIAHMVMADEDLTREGGMVPLWQVQIASAEYETLIVYTENATWNKPQNLSSVTVTAIGGGGGGGSGRRGYIDATNGGGGGGGGGKSGTTVLAENLGDTEAVAVGGGGAGGPASSPLTQFVQNGTRGTNGGDSSFGTHVTAEGGEGGLGGNQGSTQPTGSPPASGRGGDGNIADGGDGGYSTGGGGTSFPGEDSAAGPGGGSGGGRTIQFQNNIPATAGGVGSDGTQNNAGGVAGAIQQNGGNGVDNDSASDVEGGGGGGGGGSGVYNSFPDIGGYGGVGNGAPGGRYGAGGGGGGAGQSQSSTGAPVGFSLQQSGAGGSGYQGVVVVYQTFSIDPPDRTLKFIVEDIAKRANIGGELIDTTLLPDVEIDGLVITNQYPAAQALLSLGQIYNFDVTKYDGKIRFIPRGANSVATITEDDMVADDQDIEEAKRADAINIPRTLHLNYYDIDSGGLSTHKQSSERAGDRRSVGEMSIQSAVVMDADLAAQSVVVAHKIMVEDQKGEVRFALGDNWLKLVPTDPVIVQYEGKSVRCRVHQVDIMDGQQQYIMLRDRQSAYTADVEGIPPPVLPTPPSQASGPTAIAVLDIPLLQDADDNAGLALYVAICGVTDAWSGATVELSYDGGANYIRSSDGTAASIMGVLTSSLPDHPQDYPDETNEFSVLLYPANAELEESDLAGMMNGANLAAIGNHEDGWELVNFANAQQDSNGEWLISHLLRGRKHTATRSHPEDTLFVLLDRALLGLEPASIADIGRTMTFRATTFGQPVDTGTVVELDFAGATQIEYPPAYVYAVRDGSDIDVTWQAVHRIGSGVATAHGIRFTGYRVTFDDGADQIVVETGLTAITQDVSSLSGAVTVRVQQLNSLTGAGPATEVIVP